MTDSFFIDVDKFIVKGCCESVGADYMTHNNSFYEAIYLPEIGMNFRDTEVLDKYIEMVSMFTDVDIKRERPKNEIKMNGYSYNINDIIFYKIGPWSSNKHFIMAHTLIRYLWYEHYHNIVDISLNFRYAYPDMDVEDIFAIAHSFQSNNDRGLLGKEIAGSNRLVLFRDNKSSIEMIKKGNSNINTVYDGNIYISMSHTLKGDFFENKGKPALSVDAKRFISYFEAFDKTMKIEYNGIFNKVIGTYSKFKRVYMDVIKYADSCKLKINNLSFSASDGDMKSYVIQLVDAVGGVKTLKGESSDHLYKSIESKK